MGFIEVNEYFWISFTLLLKMQGVNNLKTFLGSRCRKLHVAYINSEGKAKFQLESNKNKVVSPHLSPRTPN